MVMGDSLETGLRLVDRGIALTPGSSFCWFSSGWIRVIAGQVDLGAEHLEASMRLDPLSMLRPFQLAFLGLARFDQGRFADAAALLEAAVQLSPSHPIAPLVLPACYAHLKTRWTWPEGRWSTGQALTSRPIAEEAIFAFRDLAHRKRFLDGIALAEARPNEQPQAPDPRHSARGPRRNSPSGAAQCGSIKSRITSAAGGRGRAKHALLES